MKVTLSKKYRMKLLTVLFLLTCFQNLKMLSTESYAIKPYHVLAILLLFCLLGKRKLTIPPKAVCLFFAYMVICSLFNATTFGISSFLFNYVFIVYIMLIVMNTGIDFSTEDWLIIIRRSFLIMTIVIWIKNLFEIQIIINFLRHPYGHPGVTSFFGGGVNLEATYMAMMIPAFNNKKSFYAYAISSVLLSVIYASRVGILINLLCLLWYLLIHLNRKQIIRLISALVIGTAVGIFMYYKGLANYVVERFFQIGQEKGSVGRLNMWKHAWRLFNSRLWGCGIGNSIASLERLVGRDYTEGNFHNVYIQMFIDLGLIGGFYYIALVLRFLRTEAANLRNNPLSMIIVAYFAGSFFQFRGPEVIAFFCLAAYFQQRDAIRRYQIRKQMITAKNRRRNSAYETTN